MALEDLFPLWEAADGVGEVGLDPKYSEVSPGSAQMRLFEGQFEGEEQLGRVLARPRAFVSFGPAILYSKKLLRSARKCPPESVLVESDGPVPFAALGGPEGPGLVPSVAFRLAELWGKSLDDTVLQLSSNAASFLG